MENNIHMKSRYAMVVAAVGMLEAMLTLTGCDLPFSRRQAEFTLTCVDNGKVCIYQDETLVDSFEGNSASLNSDGTKVAYATSEIERSSKGVRENSTGVHVYDIESGKHTEVSSSGQRPQFTPRGSVMYRLDDKLFMAGSSSPFSAGGLIEWINDDRYVLLNDKALSVNDLQGQKTKVVQGASSFRLSTDRTRVAYSSLVISDKMQESGVSVKVYDLASAVTLPLAFFPIYEQSGNFFMSMPPYAPIGCEMAWSKDDKNLACALLLFVDEAEPTTMKMTRKFQSRIYIYDLEAKTKKQFTFQHPIQNIFFMGDNKLAFSYYDPLRTTFPTYSGGRMLDYMLSPNSLDPKLLEAMGIGRNHPCLDVDKICIFDYVLGKQTTLEGHGLEVRKLPKKEE